MTIPAGLPNTRMQRTRSSPSALRSPLMRCPLGVAIVVFVSIGCAERAPQAATAGRPDVSIQVPIIRVVDRDGVGLPGVTVLLCKGAADAVRVVTTSAQGEALFPGLAVGTYRIQAGLQGLRMTDDRPQLTVTGNEPARATVHMEVWVDHDDLVVPQPTPTPLACGVA